MKTFTLVSTLLGFALVGSNLFAADTPASKISASQLAALGLGNLKAMSHEAALEVRGKGIGENGGGWSEDRRGWNSWGDKSHHHHHHQTAHCQAPSHCQPCLAPCHIACGLGGCSTPARAFTDAAAAAPAEF